MPVFKKKYPGTKMILILDNALYHHKCGILSSSRLAKGKIVDEKEKYMGAGDYILLPITEHTVWRSEQLSRNPGLIVEKEDGHYLRVPFVPVCLWKRANKIDVPNVDELKLAFVQWLGEHQPDLFKKIRCRRRWKGTGTGLYGRLPTFRTSSRWSYFGREGRITLRTSSSTNKQ